MGLEWHNPYKLERLLIEQSRLETDLTEFFGGPPSSELMDFLLPDSRDTSLESGSSSEEAGIFETQQIATL